VHTFDAVVVCNTKLTGIYYCSCEIFIYFLKCNFSWILCSAERSLPTLWVGTSGGLVCVYEFTLGSTADIEQPPPLKCVLGKQFALLTFSL